MWHGDLNASTAVTQIKIEYRVVHYYARYAKTQSYEPPTVCCRTGERCNSRAQKARDPSMSRGENWCRHNTIENIIIVKGGGKKYDDFTRPMALPTSPPDQTCSRLNSSHKGSCPHP